MLFIVRRGWVGITAVKLIVNSFLVGLEELFHTLCLLYYCLQLLMSPHLCPLLLLIMEAPPLIVVYCIDGLVWYSCGQVDC